MTLTPLILHLLKSILAHFLIAFFSSYNLYVNNIFSRAHYLTTSEIRFEVVKAPGKVLRVTDLGRVEFSTCYPDDPTSRFKFELTLQETVYLKCSAHLQKINDAGEAGWFLALSADGSLLGNSHRGPQAQWSLVAQQQPYLVRPSLMLAPQPNTVFVTTPAPAPIPAPASAPATSSSPPGFGFSLSSLNPFRRSSSTPAEQDTELNPMQTQSQAPRNSPAAAASASRGLALLRGIPAYVTFARSIKPELLASIEADPVGFVGAVQSPELWALLDALPPDFRQLSEGDGNHDSHRNQPQPQAFSGAVNNQAVAAPASAAGFENTRAMTFQSAPAGYTSVSGSAADEEDEDVRIRTAPREQIPAKSPGEGQQALGGAKSTIPARNNLGYPDL